MKSTCDDLAAIYRAGIDAVSPHTAVLNGLKLKGNMLIVPHDGGTAAEFNLSQYKNIIVVGGGKGTAPMARAVEDLLGDRISAGCVSLKYGYVEPLRKIEVIEASHPLPDAQGLKAAGTILDLISKAGERDLVISLISGGGSALLPLPAASIPLDDKIAATNLLLRSGANIHEMNAVRKHLSLVKGGNLAKAAYPATVINLMISDVSGDDMDVIASGPFVPDKSTYGDALGVLEKYTLGGQVPASVRAHLDRGAAGEMEETPKPGSPVFGRVTNLIIASNIIALKAGAAVARKLGYNTVILSSVIEGETREVARMHTAIAREALLSGNPVRLPACIISGGEATVTVTGSGLGGRNMEFALQCALLLEGREGILAASIGTDGSDGPTDAAGAWADGTTCARARARGVSVNDYVANNDSYRFFKEIGDLIVTGPTNTNVMDMRIMLVR
ncbi:MAG: glycerate kinase [Spirochaetes bacterium]|nr:MAG: glycerate kinase [Spirochaetota bacterium]